MLKYVVSLACHVLLIIPAYAQDTTYVGKIRILVDAAYDNSEQSFEKIKTFSEKLPPTQVELKEGMTLSNLIVNHYKFGPSNLFKTSGYLLNAIIDLNGIKDPAKILPGKYLIPTLPPRTQPRLAMSIPHQVAASYSCSAPLDHGWDTTRKDKAFYFNEVAVSEPTRKSSRKVYVEFEMPLDIIDSLLMSDSVLFSNSVSEADLPLEIEAIEDVSPDSEFVFQNFRKEPFDSLQKYIKRKAYIFILDTGFPNQQRYAESISAFTRIMDEAWKELSMKSPNRKYPETFTAPSCNHCNKIEQSIAPILKISGMDSAVQVIYVPISKEQGGDQMLFELIRYHKLRRLYPYDYETLKIPQHDIASVDKETKKLLDRLPVAIGSSCSGKNVKTNYDVINALQDVGNFIATKENTTFFINLSWNPKRQNTHISTINSQRGLFTVSAGNIPRDILEDNTPFGNLVLQRGDLFTAVNINPVTFEAHCRSGWLSRHQDSQLYRGVALGYHGDLSAQHCGGTSFVAPRIAVFLAFGEAIKTEGDFISRQARLRTDILNTIDISQPNVFKAIWFDPIKYYNTITK